MLYHVDTFFFVMKRLVMHCRLSGFTLYTFYTFWFHFLYLIKDVMVLQPSKQHLYSYTLILKEDMNKLYQSQPSWYNQNKQGYNKFLFYRRSHFIWVYYGGNLLFVFFAFVFVFVCLCYLPYSLYEIFFHSLLSLKPK